MAEDRTRLLRALKRERMHIDPHALDASPLRVRRAFAHAWAPADLFLEQLDPWPSGLLRYWLATPAGHIVFSTAPTAYLPQGLPWFGGELPAVARIALADLIADPRPPLEVCAHLLDHLLGSQGREDAPWLSDGAGATGRLQALGQHIRRLARLGYGPTEPHAYFAWALAGYWLDRQALNIADPHIERLLRTTLCDERFWS